MQVTQQTTNPLPFWALKRPDLISLKAPEPVTNRGRRKRTGIAKRRSNRRHKREYVRPFIEAILRAVCRHYGVPEKAILSRNRTEKIAWPRMVFCTVARHLTPAFDGEIGAIVKRQGTAVAHAATEVETRIDPDELETVRTLARREIRKIKQLAA